MKKTPDRMKLVLVEWEDSYNGDHNWFMKSEIARSIEPVVLYTVGFLAREMDERVTLSVSWQPGGEEHDDRLCDLFTIPRSCIRKITVLRR